MSQTTISTIIDSLDKKAFENICEKNGFDPAYVLNMFIKKVISEEKIPFEIPSIEYTLIDDRQKGLQVFYELREEAQKNGLQDMTLEEINLEIKAVREGK